jgi:Cys-rich protein (TIGR01571 family)
MAWCCASCRVAQMAGRLGHSAWIGIAVMFFIAEAMNIFGTEQDRAPTYDDDCNNWVRDMYPAISPNDAPTTYLSIPSTDTYWFDTCRPKQFAKFGIKLALAIAGWIGMTVVLLMIRRAVVAKYQIHETALKSWVLSCFCGFCTLYQVSAEVDFAERGRLDACSTDCKVRAALPATNPTGPPPMLAACTHPSQVGSKHPTKSPEVPSYRSAHAACSLEFRPRSSPRPQPTPNMLSQHRSHLRAKPRCRRPTGASPAAARHARHHCNRTVEQPEGMFLLYQNHHQVRCLPAPRRDRDHHVRWDPSVL